MVKAHATTRPHNPSQSLLLKSKECAAVKYRMPHVVRKWEIFPGKNKFYCNGRIMMARHSGIFLFTFGLIVLTAGLFFAFDCPYLAVHITPAIPVIAGTLFIFVIGTLLRTSFTDPGVIPRATAAEAADIERQIEVPNAGNTTSYRPPPRTKEIIIKGQTIKLKYCFTCKIFRPPRASHCSICDNCVDRFDHHCPWVGNCVGRRNYRYFYLFILSLAFLCVFILSCVVTHLILLSKDRTFFQAVQISPASLVEGVICFLSVWSILGLAGFHTYLTSSNQTTNEDIKGSFSRRRGQDQGNPFGRGSICSNCLYMLCSPLPPSLIDRRGIVTPDLTPEVPRIPDNKDRMYSVVPVVQIQNGQVAQQQPPPPPTEPAGPIKKQPTSTMYSTEHARVAEPVLVYTTV